MLDMLEYARICWDTVGYAWMCLDTLGYAGIRWDTLRYARKVKQVPRAPWETIFDSILMPKSLPRGAQDLPRGSKKDPIQKA